MSESLTMFYYIINIRYHLLSVSAFALERLCTYVNASCERRINKYREILHSASLCSEWQGWC